MYIYEEIIEPFLQHKEEYVISNIINGTVRQYNLKEFITKIETKNLTEAEIVKQLDNYKKPNGLYFYLGNQIGFNELMKILKNDFKKVIIKMEPIDVIEIADTLTLKNNVKYMNIPNSICDLH